VGEGVREGGRRGDDGREKNSGDRGRDRGLEVGKMGRGREIEKLKEKEKSGIRGQEAVLSLTC
jgi:hypothetical protein